MVAVGTSKGARSRLWVVFVALFGASLAVPAWAAAQVPAVVPINLQVLEQKMAQIRFDTARISGRAVLGEMGPAVSGAELGAAAKGSNTLVSSTVAAVRLSPPESTSTGKIEAPKTSGHMLGSGHTLGLGAGVVRERTIGSTVYTYRPSVASFDGGRPWVRSTRRAPQTGGESAGIAGISDSPAAPASGTGAGSTPIAPFAKLIEDVNSGLSVQEVGPVTVDGQQTIEFTVSSSLERVLSPKQLAALTKATSTLGALLSPTESPKQHAEAKKHREEAARKLGHTPVQLELFIAPSGLPVRRISILGNRTSGIGGEEDILALEVPVDVHAPPPRETIGQARLRKLERKHRGPICGLISVHTASKIQPAICPRSPSKRA
jgi:hypothetical protein